MKKHKRYKLKPRVKKVLLSSILVLIIGLLSIVLFNNGTNILNSVKNYFAAGDVPAHNKTIEDNHNGTHKLSLDVTGDTDVNKKAANVNVLVILDTSSSMENNNAGTGNNPPRRSDAAEKVVYDFATDLFSYQDKINNPSNIQMSLVTFDSYATTSVQQNWTSTLNDITGKLSDTGARDSRQLDYHSGTNWEAGLRTGINDVLSRADNDPTFVIFVTDGAPYRRMNPQGNGQQTVGMYEGYNAAKDEARTAATYKTGNDPKGNVTFYGIYAYGDEGDYLDDLVYYALNGRERATVNSQTQDTPNYYNASDTASLTSAISTIFEDIVTAMGVSDVKIEDGTTQNVKTSTGDIAHLLNVDPSSLEYWLNIPLTKDGNNYYFTDNNANKINVIVDGTTATFNWTDSKGNQHTATYQDAIITNLKLKVKWNEKTDFYPAAPTASINASGESSSVDWDLSSLKALLNGVTYTVTFDVYPTQDTYDMIAQIKNGKTAAERRAMYENLDDNIRRYLKNTNNEYDSFTLLTNTTATLDYDDTRTPQDEEAVLFPPADPVSTDASKITVTKKWENDFNDQDTQPITLELYQEQEKIYEMTLGGENPWSESRYIATGLIKTIKNEEDEVVDIKVLDTGYDYTLKEKAQQNPDDMLSYHWELQAETIHPMVIGEDLVTLVKIEDEDIPGGISGKNYYVDNQGRKFYRIGDEVFYAKYEGDTANITATNYRKSNLNVKKIVEGDQLEETEFTFNFKVENEGDNEVWFSVYDPKAGATVKDLDTDATAEEGNTGYYYVTENNSGLATFYVKMQADWNLRIINLGTASTYEVEEVIDGQYQLKKVEADTLVKSTKVLPVGAEPNGTDSEGNRLWKYGDVIYT